MKRVFWAWLHNVVAHGIEGWFTLLTFGRSTPAWVDRFHDWTADHAWGNTVRPYDSNLCESRLADLGRAIDEHGPDSEEVENLLRVYHDDADFVATANATRNLLRRTRGLR